MSLMVSINKLPLDTTPVIAFRLTFSLSKEAEVFGQGD